MTPSSLEKFFVDGAMYDMCVNAYKLLVDWLLSNHRTISTMESCTGGQIAEMITEVAGSSGAFSGAFVSYSNEAKIKLGVDAKIIEEFGVYSVQTAEAMAKCCAVFFNADLGIGVTGTLNGKDPANDDSEEGVYHFAVYDREKGEIYCAVTNTVSTYSEFTSRHTAKLDIAYDISKIMLKYIADRSESDEQ